MNTENLSNLYIPTFNGLKKVSHVCKETFTVTIGNIYDTGRTIPCHAFTNLILKEEENKEENPVVTMDDANTETPLEENTVQDITETQKQLLLSTVKLSIYKDYIFKLDIKEAKKVLKQLREDGIEIKVKLNADSRLIGTEVARLLKVGFMRPLYGNNSQLG